jgi:xylan 1,4-beta-xylosidase
MTLRVHADESWLSLSARPGFLRLKGREGLSSRFLQSLVARRLDALSGRAETCLEFEPGDFRHMAGLVLWYDTTNYYYLRVSRDEEKGTCIGIILADNGEIDQPVPDLPIPEGSPIYLRAELDAANLAFSWSPDGLSWTPVGPILDASTLSDEYPGEGRFTGAMIGLCCQDMAGTGRFADFDYFEWQVR